jgi:hypothetical protein
MRDGRQIARGFPSGLRADVDVVVAALPEPQHVLSTRTQTLSVQGEAVELPGRVYNPELSDRAIAALSETQRLIAGCVYARHHDGYVRQAACESIVAAANRGLCRTSSSCSVNTSWRSPA